MLINTSTVRTWLALKDGDDKPNAKIENLIKAVQKFCDVYTGRQLEAQQYLTDPQFSYYDGDSKPWIYTKQYPVSHVNSINIDSDRVFGAGTVLSTADIFYYPSGKIVSEAGYFTRGRRNVLIDYNAGYAPIVGGTHNSAVSSYPAPYDLTQTMTEMVSQSFKEGITLVHTVQTGGAEQTPKFIQMLSKNSFWRRTLNAYKRLDIGLDDREE